jgi:hypothetical protein
MKAKIEVFESALSTKVIATFKTTQELLNWNAKIIKNQGKMTLEEIKDLSVIIVGDLVLNSLVKDCTDTDDETEFEFQDVIVETLCQKFKVKNDE